MIESKPRTRKINKMPTRRSGKRWPDSLPEKKAESKMPPPKAEPKPLVIPAGTGKPVTVRSGLERFGSKYNGFFR